MNVPVETHEALYHAFKKTEIAGSRTKKRSSGVRTNVKNTFHEDSVMLSDYWKLLCSDPRTKAQWEDYVATKLPLGEEILLVQIECRLMGVPDTPPVSVISDDGFNKEDADEGEEDEVEDEESEEYYDDEDD